MTADDENGTGSNYASRDPSISWDGKSWYFQQGLQSFAGLGSDGKGFPFSLCYLQQQHFEDWKVSGMGSDIP